MVPIMSPRHMNDDAAATCIDEGTCHPSHAMQGIQTPHALKGLLLMHAHMHVANTLHPWNARPCTCVSG